MQILFVFDNDRAHEASRFIYVTLDRDTGDHVAEFDLAAFVSENRHVVWVPLHEGFAFLDCGAVVFRDH